MQLTENKDDCEQNTPNRTSATDIKRIAKINGGV